MAGAPALAHTPTRRPHDPRSSTPAVDPPPVARVQRLADAGGGAVGIDVAGRASVEFPLPGGQVANRGPAAARTASAPAPLVLAGPQGDQEAVFEELYDRLLDSLRRDLLVERERVGGLALDWY